MSTLTREIKKLALSGDVDYVGVASVDRFKNVPDGWKPTDLLESCRSAVSSGIRIDEGEVANQQAYRFSDTRSTYMWSIANFSRIHEWRFCGNCA